MPIRAIMSVISVRQVAVAQAIDYAVDHGAHVVTMSLGGFHVDVLERAVRRAVAADVLVLAAGNCVRFVVYPAQYDECIAVAGTDASDRPWRGSCRGAAVDISAPDRTSTRRSPRARRSRPGARGRASRWPSPPGSRRCGWPTTAGRT